MKNPIFHKGMIQLNARINEIINFASRGDAAVSMVESGYARFNPGKRFPGITDGIAKDKLVAIPGKGGDAQRLVARWMKLRRNAGKTYDAGGSADQVLHSDLGLEKALRPFYFRH